MVKFIRTVFFFALAVGLFHPPTSHAQPSNGKLRGLVVDANYARVAATTIIFAGESFVKSVRTDEDGAYEVELPAGDCVIEVKQQGFLPRRVKLHIEARVTKQLNMILDVEPVKPFKCPKGRTCLQL
jgi:hypothetical protein